MNKSIKFLLVAVAAISMASCSTGYYLSNSQNVNLSQTQVVLSQANFQVVKQVKVTYVYKNLHSMRFNASQMKESAYAALVKEAKLTGAQTLINVTMEQVQRKSQNFWTFAFGCPPKYEQAIIVSGTVIEFLPAGVTPTNSDVVESYLFGDPISGNIISESSTNTNNDATTKSTQTTADDPIENETVSLSLTETVEPDTIIEDTQSSKKLAIPQVDTNSRKSSYSQLEERYATKYPSFWENIQKVRRYFFLYNMYLEVDKMNALLLSNDEQKIGALMQEVTQQKDWNTVQLSKVFLRYVE